MRWNYIVCSLALLLTSSYVDTVRGPLIPVLAQEYSLSYAQTSWFLILGNLTSILCTFFMIPLTQRLGAREVTLLLCALGLVSAISSAGVGGMPTLMVLAVLLGSTVATIGALVNILMFKGTDPHYRARFLCALHMMYGLGSLAAPAVASYLLGQGYPWFVCLIVTAGSFLLLSGFVMARFPREPRPAPHERESARLSPMQLLVLLTFSLYVGGEVLTSMWMTSYLVGYRGMTVETSAPYLSGFFLTMTITRGICFLSLKPRFEKYILCACIVLSVLFFMIGYSGRVWAFPLAGLLGPFFPLYLARMSRIFPRQAGTITIWILTCMQITLALCHFAVGELADHIGIGETYLLPPLMLTSSLALFLVYLRLERRFEGRIA